MLDRADVMFANEMARFIDETLNGDDKVQGLFENLVNVQSWDDLNRARGEIAAYKTMRNKMDEIVRRLNGEQPDHHQADRRMN